MESLSIASIIAWHQQNLDMQIGISDLKKSMDAQSESAMILLESVVTPMTEVSVPAPVPVIDGALGQNIDVSM
jgi:hypothetical protein